MRKTFAFNLDRKLKSNYGNSPKPAPVIKIRKPTSAEESHQQALKDKRELDTMRHIKARQEYIDTLGEEAGKIAFFAMLQEMRGFWGEKNYNELVKDMQEIIRGSK